jgi:hypothetical protein
MIERYATPSAWAEYFREKEGAQITHSGIRGRLEKAKIVGKNARAKVGCVLRGLVYSESDVRRVCGELISPDIPYAGEDGFFEKEGESYGTIVAWSKVLPISAPTIDLRARAAKIKSIKGKTPTGFISDYYSETGIRKACADTLGEFPKSGRDGFFIKDGVRYGTCRAWGKRFGLGQATIENRLEKISAQFKSIQGKSIEGGIRNFFAEADVLSACSDILKNLPQANVEGFFEKEGLRYGTKNAWSILLGVDGGSVHRGLKKAGVAGIDGKDVGGRVRVRGYFPETVIRELFENWKEGGDPVSHFAESLEVSQKHIVGFIEHKGQKYGRIWAWAKQFDLAPGTVQSKLRKFPCRVLRVKSSNGVEADFYSETEVLQACGDVLASLRASAEGLLVMDKEEYGNISYLSKKFQVTENLIKERAKNEDIRMKTSKNGGGSMTKYYLVSDVQRALADIFESFPQANEEDLIIEKGVRMRTIRACIGQLINHPSEESIVGRLDRKKVEALRRRNGKGKIINFYPEEEVIRACHQKLFVRTNPPKPKKIFSPADDPMRLPWADEAGFFEKGEVRFASATSWSKFLKSQKEVRVAPFTILNLLKEAGKKGVAGRDQRHKIWENSFYAEPDVMEILSGYFVDHPRADEKGFFEKEKIRFASCNTWAKHFNQSHGTKIDGRTIQVKLRAAGFLGLAAYDCNGIVHDGAYYAEPDVFGVISEYLKAYLQADENGFVFVDGVRCASANTWEKYFKKEGVKIGSALIDQRLGEDQKVGITAINFNGRLCEKSFFPEPAVRELCRDLIERKKSNPKPR